MSEFKKMIVFENDHLIVIDKPCGYPCQSGSGLAKTPTIDALGNAYCQSEAFLVHRLDMAASGLMCLAKSHSMAKHISQLMRERKVGKTYSALICSGQN